MCLIFALVYQQWKRSRHLISRIFFGGDDWFWVNLAARGSWIRSLWRGFFLRIKSDMVSSLGKQVLGLLWCLWGCSTGKGWIWKMQGRDRDPGQQKAPVTWERRLAEMCSESKPDLSVWWSPFPLESWSTLVFPAACRTPSQSAFNWNIRETMPMCDISTALQSTWHGPLDCSLGTPAPSA